MPAASTSSPGSPLRDAARLAFAHIDARARTLLPPWSAADAAALRGETARQLTRQADAAAVLGPAVGRLVKGITLRSFLEPGGPFGPSWPAHPFASPALTASYRLREPDLTRGLAALMGPQAGRQGQRRAFSFLSVLTELAGAGAVRATLTAQTRPSIVAEHAVAPRRRGAAPDLPAPARTRIDLMCEWPVDEGGRRAVVVVEAKLGAVVGEGQLRSYREEAQRRARGGPVALIVDFNNLDERRHFGEFYEQLLNDLQSAGNAGEFYTPRAVTAFMVDRTDPHPGETLFDPACGTGGFLTCAINHMEKAYVRTPKQRERMQGALRAVEKKQLPHMLCVTNMLLHGVEDPSFVRHGNTLARPLISWGKDERVEIVVTNPPFGGKEEDGIENNFPTFRTKETADLFLALIVRLLKDGGRAAVVLPDGTLFGEGIKTRLKEHLMEECDLHTIVRLPSSVFKPYASIGTNLLFFEKGRPTKETWFYEHRVPEGQKAYSMTKPIRLEHFQGCIDWWGGKVREGREETPQAWRVGIEEVQARGYNLDIKNPHEMADDHGDPAALLASLARAEAETATYRDQLRASNRTVCTG